MSLYNIRHENCPLPPRVTSFFPVYLASYASWQDNHNPLHLGNNAQPASSARPVLRDSIICQRPSGGTRSPIEGSLLHWIVQGTRKNNAKWATTARILRHIETHLASNDSELFNPSDSIPRTTNRGHRLLGSVYLLSMWEHLPLCLW